MAHVVVTRLLIEAAHRHILDHAGAQRADRSVGKMGGHRGDPLRAEGLLDLQCSEADALIVTPYRSPSANIAPTLKRAIPRERVRCVPGMLNSSEVKVLYPT
jgi:hypothetical protein